MSLYGPYAKELGRACERSLNGEANTVVYSNDKLVIKINEQGGIEVHLKTHIDVYDKQLYLALVEFCSSLSATGSVACAQPVFSEWQIGFAPRRS